MHGLALPYTGLRLNSQLVQPLVAHLLGLDHRILALLVEENPTARLCLLMERALKGYGDLGEAQRWGRMAVSAC